VAVLLFVALLFVVRDDPDIVVEVELFFFSCGDKEPDEGVECSVGGRAFDDTFEVSYA
jgi:hypothetical protein